MNSRIQLRIEPVCVLCPANVQYFQINMNNAMETFFSMDNAPILPQEFKKDKSSERKKDQPRWKATDLSDAADNLFYWLLSPLLGDQYPTNEMILLPGR